MKKLLLILLLTTFYFLLTTGTVHAQTPCLANHNLGIFINNVGAASSYISQVNPDTILLLDDFSSAGSIPSSTLVIGRASSLPDNDFNISYLDSRLAPVMGTAGIDVWQGFNEPIANFRSNYATNSAFYLDLIAHDHKLIDLALANNKAVCLGNFKEGYPQTIDADFQAYAANVSQYASTQGVTAYLCVHEHEVTATWDFGTRYNGRFTQLRPYFNNIPVIVTVAGFDGHAGPGDTINNDGWQSALSADQYLPMLLSYQSAAKSAGARGVAVFQVGLGGQWDSFDISPLLAIDSSDPACSGDGGGGGGGSENCSADYDKISVMAAYNVLNAHAELLAFVEAAQPPVVTLMDDAISRAGDIKAASPDTIIIGRVFNGSFGSNLPDPSTSVDQKVNEWIASLGGYINNNDVDYWQGYNEPNTNTSDGNDRMAWLAEFEVARIKKLASLNPPKQACVGNFGTWHPDASRWPLFEDAFQAIEDYGGIMCLHEYGLEPNMPIDGINLGRFQIMYDYLGSRNIQTVISETGIDRGGDADNDGWRMRTTLGEYLSALKGYDDFLSGESRIIGATIFILGHPGWPSFELAGDFMAALIEGAKNPGQVLINCPTNPIFPPGYFELPPNWTLPLELQSQYCTMTENHPLSSRPAICGSCFSYVPRPVKSCAGNFTYYKTLKYNSLEGSTCVEAGQCVYHEDSCTIDQAAFYNCCEDISVDAWPTVFPGKQHPGDNCNPCTDCPMAPENCQSDAYQEQEDPITETENLIVGPKPWQGRFTLNATSVIQPYMGNDYQPPPPYQPSAIDDGESREMYIADYLDGVLYYDSPIKPLSNPPSYDPASIYGNDENYNRIQPLDPRFFSYEGIFPKLAPQYYLDVVRINHLERVAASLLIGQASLNISIQSWAGDQTHLAGFFPGISLPPQLPINAPNIKPLPPSENTPFIHGQPTWEEYFRKLNEWNYRDNGKWYRLWTYVPVASREDSPFEFLPIPQQPAVIMPIMPAVSSNQSSSNLAQSLPPTISNPASSQPYSALQNQLASLQPFSPQPSQETQNYTSKNSALPDSALQKNLLAQVGNCCSVDDNCGDPGVIECQDVPASHPCSTLGGECVQIVPGPECIEGECCGPWEICRGGVCVPDDPNSPRCRLTTAPTPPAAPSDVPPTPSPAPGEVQDAPPWIDGQIPHVRRAWDALHELREILLPYIPPEIAQTYAENPPDQTLALSSSPPFATSPTPPPTQFASTALVHPQLYAQEESFSPSDSPLETNNYQLHAPNSSAVLGTTKPNLLAQAPPTPSTQLALGNFNESGPFRLITSPQSVIENLLPFSRFFSPIKKVYAQLPSSYTITNSGHTWLDQLKENPGCWCSECGPLDNPQNMGVGYWFGCVWLYGEDRNEKGNSFITFIDNITSKKVGTNLIIDYCFYGQGTCADIADCMAPDPMYYFNGSEIYGFGGSPAGGCGAFGGPNPGLRGFCSSDSALPQIVIGCGGSKTFSVGMRSDSRIPEPGCAPRIVTSSCTITTNTKCDIETINCEQGQPPPPGPPACGPPPLGSVPQCSGTIRTGPGDFLCGQETYDLLVQPGEIFWSGNPHPQEFTEPNGTTRPGDAEYQLAENRCGADMACLQCNCVDPDVMVCEDWYWGWCEKCNTVCPPIGDCYKDCYDVPCEKCPNWDCCGPGSSSDTIYDDAPGGDTNWVCEGNYWPSSPICSDSMTCMRQKPGTSGVENVESNCCIKPYGSETFVTGGTLCASNSDLFPYKELTYQGSREIHIATNLPFYQNIRSRMYDSLDYKSSVNPTRHKQAFAGIYRIITPYRGPLTPLDPVPWVTFHNGEASGTLTITDRGDPGVTTSINGQTQITTPFFFPFLGGIQDATSFVRDCLTVPYPNLCSSQDLTPPEQDPLQTSIAESFTIDQVLQDILDNQYNPPANYPDCLDVDFPNLDSPVTKGQAIAYIDPNGGNHPCATAAHLHFGASEGGSYVDPTTHLGDQYLGSQINITWNDSSVPQPSFNGPWDWPVDTIVTQGFGMTDFAKSGAYNDGPHNGIDMVQSSDPTIYAVSDGTFHLTERDCQGQPLTFAIVDHGNELKSIYTHIVTRAADCQNIAPTPTIPPPPAPPTCQQACDTIYPRYDYSYLCIDCLINSCPDDQAPEGNQWCVDYEGSGVANLSCYCEPPPFPTCEKACHDAFGEYSTGECADSAPGGQMGTASAGDRYCQENESLSTCWCMP